MAKTKCVSLCLRYIIYMLFSLLFIFSLSQSAYTWGFGLQGRSPLRQSSTKLTLSTERGERGGEAAAPAGRKLPQEARAARSRGRAKTRCRRHALKRWLGSGKVSTDGLQGRSPLRQSSAERGERGGAAAAPAGRKLPQEARAARSWGRAKTRCRRHALKRWLGSGEVSSDGLQGAQPPAMSALRVYIKNQSKRCIACSAMKVKTMF